MAGHASRTIAQTTGGNAERRALKFLQKNGLILISKNYRCRLGEIDLVMLDGHCVVFVEVRYRKNSHFASAAESVDRRKQDKLVRTAAIFLGRQPKYSSRPVRFDVIAFDQVQDRDCKLQWIKDAFRPQAS